MDYRVLHILALTLIKMVSSYPTGAPTTACSTFRPNHGVNLPQSSISPYLLDLSEFAVASSFVYNPGQQYSIRLHSSSGTVPFKGFIIQANSVYNVNKIVGSFSDLPNGTKYISCSYSNTVGTLTHNNTNRDNFYSLTFTWTAPSVNSGPVRFRYTVVQSYNVFWSGTQSEILQETTNGYLIIGNQADIKTANLDGNNLRTLTNSPTNAIGVDFDFRKNYLFWADYGILSNDISIKRSLLDGSDVSTLVSVDLITPTSVAVDWINSKIYWTDENASRIEVAELSGSNRKVLFDTNMQHPRDLTIDPTTRYIYWIDWGTETIEKASMDGTSRKVLHNTNLYDPVSITIDYQSQTLYWIDSTLEKMEKSTVNGSNRQTLLSTQTVLDNAGEMTLLGNTLYWAERVRRALYSTNINSPQNYQLLVSGLLNEAYGLKVVHPLRQPQATNPCKVNNGGCQQLCLLSATSLNGYTCRCANGFLPSAQGSSQCTAAPIYPVAFCISGINYCTSWKSILSAPKLLKVGLAMINGVRSLCNQCGNDFSSGNLLSTTYSSFTCQSNNNSLVQYNGYIYGYSLTNNAPLLAAINQWTSSIPTINVFRDSFQVASNCSDFIPQNNTETGISFSTEVIAGISAAAAVVILCALCCCCCYVVYRYLSSENTNVPQSRRQNSPTSVVVHANTYVKPQKAPSPSRFVAMRETEFQETPEGTKVAIQKDTVVDPVTRQAVQKETVIAQRGGAAVVGQRVKGFHF